MVFCFDGYDFFVIIFLDHIHSSRPGTGWFRSTPSFPLFCAVLSFLIEAVASLLGPLQF